jgi:3-phosphoshikimate 1-carboxyvinyltransferase
MENLESSQFIWDPERDYLTIKSIKRVAGSVRLPGSKSISNRALLLAAVCEEPTQLRYVLNSDDTEIMRQALDMLGIPMRWNSSFSEGLIVGGGGRWAAKSVDENGRVSIFLGNAGTVARPLTAMLAVLTDRNPYTYYLHGVSRMHERPIGDLMDALSQWHIPIRYLQNPGFPPFELKPPKEKSTVPITTVIKGNTSSQFVSALLMAAPFAAKTHSVDICVSGELISRPYVDMTLQLMADFGVVVKTKEEEVGLVFTIPTHQGTSPYQSPGTYAVEGDASSASYFLAWGLVAGDEQEPLVIRGVGRDSIQGDLALVDALTAMGAKVEVMAHELKIYRSAWEQGELKGVEWDCTRIPDAAMTLAILALFATGCTTLNGIASWKVKETDRIVAMANELRKVGAKVETTDNSIRVFPPTRPLSKDFPRIHTYDDHRMAMCFSLVAALGVGVVIEDPACVAKTFPTYFDVLEKIVNS